MNLEYKILSKMNPNLTDLEKARYLYIELGRELTFSTKFQNTDDKTFYSMFSEKVDITNLKTTEVNCRMWSQLYSALLSKVNIENKIVNQGHQHVEFYINGKKMIADATYGSYTDLARIKNDDETVHFGYSQRSNQVLFTQESQKELNDIDEKLGYNTDKKQNLLELKQFLSDIRNNRINIRNLFGLGEMNDSEILNFKMEYLFSKIGVLNAGYYESKDFVRELTLYFLTDEERQRVGGVELMRTNRDKSVNIVQCIYVKKDDCIDYYLLAPNLPVQKFSPNQILSLAIKGYGKRDKEIPGIDYPRNFKKGIIDKNIKYSLQKIMMKFKQKEDIDKYAEYTEFGTRTR